MASTGATTKDRIFRSTGLMFLNTVPSLIERHVAPTA